MSNFSPRSEKFEFQIIISKTRNHFDHSNFEFVVYLELMILNVVLPEQESDLLFHRFDNFRLTDSIVESRTGLKLIR